MVQVVPIQQVIASGEQNKWSVRKMTHVLLKQGQIEPLQVAKYTVLDGKQIYITFYNDPHGADIVDAAKLLGWDTLLIVEMRAYDRE